jgi:uncharacterized membrane protein YphA (DoxX/SURF4 family)
VFAVAAVAKLRQPASAARSFAALGLPASGVLAYAVPAAEAGLAVALVAAPRAAAWAAIALLAAFTAVLARAVIKGTGAPCACFGSARRASEPVSGVELVRNAMLAALAVVATGAPAGAASVPTLPALVVVTLLVAAGRVVLALVDLRRHGGSIWPGVPS